MVWRETLSPTSTRVVGHKRLVTVFTRELDTETPRDEEAEKTSSAEIQRAEQECRRSQEKRTVNLLESPLTPAEVRPAEKVRFRSKMNCFIKGVRISLKVRIYQETR